MVSHRDTCISRACMNGVITYVYMRASLHREHRLPPASWRLLPRCLLPDEQTCQMDGDIPDSFNPKNDSSDGESLPEGWRR